MQGMHEASSAMTLFLVGNLTCSVSLGCCEMDFSPLKMHSCIHESKEFEPKAACFFQFQFGMLASSHL